MSRDQFFTYFKSLTFKQVYKAFLAKPSKKTSLERLQAETRKLLGSAFDPKSTRRSTRKETNKLNNQTRKALNKKNPPY